jgi:hypothetical protein
MYAYDVDYDTYKATSCFCVLLALFFWSSFT